MEKNFERLNWDSDFFGCNVYKIKKIDLSDFKYFKKNKSFCYYENFDKIDEKILSQNNGYLVNRRVIYSKEINQFEKIFLNYVEKYVNPEFDEKKMFNIFFNSGNYSRFKMDERIQKNKFLELYQEWYKNTMNYSFCDKYFILPQNKGIISFKIINEYAKIIIISVNKDFFGLGNGKKLVDMVEAYSFLKNCKKLEVETQLENKNACRFYEKCGFFISEIRNVYHFDFRGK